MKLLCLFGHKWGKPYNYREKELGVIMIFITGD